MRASKEELRASVKHVNLVEAKNGGWHVIPVGIDIQDQLGKAGDKAAMRAIHTPAKWLDDAHDKARDLYPNAIIGVRQYTMPTKWTSGIADDDDDGFAGGPGSPTYTGRRK